MEREKSVYTELEHIDSVWTPERSLWCAVVGQTIIDAASTDPEIRAEIVDWLESDDLNNVCEMAGLRPESVANLVSSILRDPDKKRAFRNAMSAKLTLRNWVDSHYGTVDTKGD